jgi:anti-anti-sigma regulatory factor
VDRRNYDIWLGGAYPDRCPLNTLRKPLGNRPWEPYKVLTSKLHSGMMLYLSLLPMSPDESVEEPDERTVDFRREGTVREDDAALESPSEPAEETLEETGEWSITKSGHMLTVTLAETLEWDKTFTYRLLEAIRRHGESTQGLTIDMGKMQICSSGVVGTLIVVQKQCKGMALTNVRPHVLDMLQRLNVLDTVFRNVQPSIDTKDEETSK